ncbi:unnamed protein product [Fusarium equiseti]|uniref:Polyketide synthase n=1 Tax=Fusarium equiseti TaxID=61235 RepID=A0A8J2IJA8_FUSEQ|nr:unnamed protein product [Fusarium equiseti]
MLKISLLSLAVYLRPILIANLGRSGAGASWHIGLGPVWLRALALQEVAKHSGASRSQLREETSDAVLTVPTMSAIALTTGLYNQMGIKSQAIEEGEAAVHFRSEPAFLLATLKWQIQASQVSLEQDHVEIDAAMPQPRG